MNTTTKRFKRTMAEAFPSGAEYACAIERTRRIDKDGYVIVGVCLLVLGLAIVGTLIGGVL